MKAAEVIRILQETFPEGAPLHTPCLTGREREYLNECIDTTFVSSVGAFVDRIEQDLAEVAGVERCVAVCSGTAALHTCLLLAGVTHGDEVLMPAFTFVATANSALHCGAIPHFVEIEEQRLGIDANLLREHLSEIAELRDGGCWNKQTERWIKALIPMHTFGIPSDMDAICQVAEEYQVPVIEDAAEALGSSYKGKHVGNFGLLSALSFNGNKIVTAGGGGAILTNNNELADKAKHITTTAKVPSKWEFIHDQMAFNYRMPNINAALACAQLEQLNQFLARKRELHSALTTKFKHCEYAQILAEPEDSESNYWLITLLLDQDYADAQEHILASLTESGIQVRPPWKCLHELDFLKDCPRADLSLSEELQRRIVSLPSSAHQQVVNA